MTIGGFKYAIGIEGWAKNPISSDLDLETFPWHWTGSAGPWRGLSAAGAQRQPGAVRTGHGFRVPEPAPGRFYLPENGQKPFGGAVPWHCFATSGLADRKNIGQLQPVSENLGMKRYPFPVGDFDRRWLSIPLHLIEWCT